MWPYAINVASFIRNRCYTDRLKNTPYFMFTGKKPNLSKMRPFGNDCYVYNVQNKQKFDSRGTKGIFLGYDRDSPAYLIYFPNTGKVSKHRVVKFVSVKESGGESVDERKTQN